jgi:hypothetical protein
MEEVMKRNGLTILLAIILLPSLIQAENVDPLGDDAQYAWGENVGWFNAQPLGPGGPGLHLHDFELTGWLWGENIGWVSLSCKNTMSCNAVPYGVTHDGNGNLGGFAWAENVGWINFFPLFDDGTGTGPTQVTIDLATGEFGGKAYGENIGWVVFDYFTAGLHRIRTTWSCSAAGGAPTGNPTLMVDLMGAESLLSWSLSADATGHDVAMGDLLALHASGGDYTAATGGCAAENMTFTSMLYSDGLNPGEGIWFLLRDVSCSGNGTYNMMDAAGGATFHTGSRDAEINAAALSCQ